MYAPLAEKYESLGTHPLNIIDKTVMDLKNRIEMERHLVTFSEVSGPR